MAGPSRDGVPGEGNGTGASSDEPEGSGSHRFRNVLLVLGAAPFVLVGLLIAALQASAVTTPLANAVLERMSPWPRTTARLRSAHLSGLEHFALRGLRIVGREGSPLVTLDSLSVGYHLLPFFHGRVELTSVELEGLHLFTRQQPDSSWDLLAPLTSGPSSGGPGVRIRIGRTRIRDASLRAEPLSSPDSAFRIEHLALTLDTLAYPELDAVTLDTVDAEIYAPSRPTAPARLSGALLLAGSELRVPGLRLVSDSSDVRAGGTLRLPGGSPALARDVDFTLKAAPLHLSDLGPFVPGLPRTGDVRLDAHLTGSTALLGVTLDARTSDGASVHLDGTLTPRTADSVRYAVRARVRRLDPGQWTGAAVPLHDIDATLTTDLKGPALDSLNGTADLQMSGRFQNSPLEGGTLRGARVEASFDSGAATFHARGRLDPWIRMTARGSGRFFAPAASWRLNASLDQLRSVSVGGSRVSSGRVQLSGHGSGLPPRNAQGRVTATLSGQWGTTAVRDASLTARWDSTAARLDLGLPVGNGSVRARARAEWAGPATRLILSSLRVRTLDLGRILTGSATGTLSLDGSGEVVLGDRGATRAELEGTLLSGSFRKMQLDTGSVALHLVNERVRGRIRVRGPAGRIRATLHGEPFAPTPALHVDSLRVRRLDAAELGSGLPTSDLDALLRLDARGRSVSELTASGTLTLDSSSLAGIQVDTAALRLSLDRGRMQVDGDARAMGGSLALHVEGEPFRDTPTFRMRDSRFDSIRAGSGPGGGPGVLLSGDLRAEASLPPDTFPRASGRLTLDGGSVGEARLDEGRLDFGVRGDTASVDGSLQLAGGRAELQAAVGLSRSGGSLALRGVRARGSADVPRLGRLLARDSVDAAVRAALAVTGHGGSLSSMSWRADLSARGHFGPARLDSLALHGGMDEGILRLDTLVLASNAVNGSGGGTVALADSAAADTAGSGVHLRFAADSVGTLSELLNQGPLAARSAVLQLDARRAGDNLVLDGSTSLGGIIRGSLAVDTLHTEFTARLRGGRPESGHARIDGRQLAVPVGVLERVKGSVSYDNGDIGFDLGARRDDRHRVRIAGTLRPSNSRAHLDTLDVQLPESDWRLDSPVTVRWGRRIDPGGLTLVSGDRSIALRGHLDRSGPQDLTVRLDSVPLSGLADLAGMSRVQGTLGGRIDVTGSPARPAIDGSLEATVNGTQTRITLAPDSAGLGVTLRARDREGRPLTVEGTVPFHFSLTSGGTRDTAPPSGALSLHLRARRFSLGWLSPFLEPVGVGRLEGRLTADTRIQGPMDSPDATGSLSLAEGRLTIPGQGIDYKGFHGRLSLEGHRIHVDSLLIRSQGTASIAGTIDLQPLSSPSLDLQTHFHRFHAVHNAWTSLQLSGDVSVSGDLSALVLKGSVQLVDTDVYTELIGQFTGGAQPVTLTSADYRMLETYFGYRPSRGAAVQKNLVDPWSFDVHVEIGSDVWARRRTQPKMNVQLGGSMDIRKQPGGPVELYGTVDALPQRSTLQEFGRQFSITKGSVTFNGAPASLRIDAQATYTVPSFRDPSASEVTITLNVNGTLDSLNLTLGSSPSMENADILSYLATGRPARSATAFGSSGAGSGGLLGAGKELALGQLTDLVERGAQQAVGLDVIDIRHNGAGGSTLVAGRYVNPRLFVGFRQPLSLDRQADAATRSVPQQTEVELEYTWYRWLLLNLQGGQSSLRAFLRTKKAF